MNDKGKLIDLSYVKAMAGDSTELVNEMINIFISQVPDFISEMRSHHQNKDWTKLGLIAHKAKSSLAVMGMEKQASSLKDLELKSKDGLDVDQYIDYIRSFENDCQTAIIELQDILNSN